MDPKKKREMIYRIVAGLLLLPVAIYVILYVPTIVFAIFLEFIIILAVREFIIMTYGHSNVFKRPLMWIGAIFIPICFYLQNFHLFFAVLFLLIFISFLMKMFSEKPTEKVFEDVSESVFASLMLPLLFSFLMLIRSIDTKWLLFLFLIVWASDTFAFFTGIAFGKHKLIPKISPAKTVEGLLGGLTGAIIVAFIVNYYLLNIGFIIMFIIAIDVIVAGVIGDLAESMLKRSNSVKDSGNLIPGHGGILDRFDSVLFAAPILYFYLYFLVNNQ